MYNYDTPLSLCKLFILFSSFKISKYRVGFTSLNHRPPVMCEGSGVYELELLGCSAIFMLGLLGMGVWEVVDGASKIGRGVGEYERGAWLAGVWLMKVCFLEGEEVEDGAV